MGALPLDCFSDPRPARNSLRYNHFAPRPAVVKCCERRAAPFALKNSQAPLNLVKRMFLSSHRARSLLAALLFAVMSAHAQSPASPAASSKNTVPPDPLGRTTPRSAMYNFLESCHHDALDRAAAYLDLRRIPLSERASKAPALARSLCIVINRDAQFELNNLSNSPEGTFDSALAPNQDLLDVFHLNGETVPLYLARENDQGRQIWLVSADSVARLPLLSALTEETPFEKHLPAPLVKTRIIGTSLWVWIVLIGIAVILSVLSRLLSRAVLALIKPLATRANLRAYRLSTFIEPLRLLIVVAAFRVAIEFFPPSALLRQYLLYLITLLVTIGVASVIMRVADLISDRILSRLDPKERALSYSVFRVGVRFVKICIFCIAVLFLLHQWGYKIDALLAGLGVGGLAVALAAQKTIENLFGGISVISDRPVLVGDYCQFGSQAGTVEDIGLRSTRIRTNDRTLVTIPNAQFSTMTLENFSRRDRIWFHPSLQLRRDTPPAKIREFMSAVERLLREHPMMDVPEVPVRFTKILDQSFSIEIFAYVKSSDYNKFLVVQSELLLKLLEIAERLNIRFALPIQESLTATLSQPASDESLRLVPHFDDDTASR
jgi:MscS family membrane protein